MVFFYYFFNKNIVFYLEFPVFLPNLKEEIKMKQTLKDSGDFTKIKMNSAL